MLKAERTLTWMRQLISAAATLFALGVALAIPVAASAAETPVTLGPVEVSQALFVAGDVARLTSIRGGTETLVLERCCSRCTPMNRASPLPPPSTM
jgi:hypothetical protein